MKKQYGLLETRKNAIISYRGAVMEKLEVGDIVSGTVTGIEDYGIFVNVNKYNGLIHISELSHSFVKKVSDFAKIGDSIEVKILEIDKTKNQLKLSIKDFEDIKPKKEKIIETKNGFSTLNNRLPNWISDKINEINLKN